MIETRVNLSERSYTIKIVNRADSRAFAEFVRACSPKSQLAIVVCDTNLKSLANGYGDALAATGMMTHQVVVPAGEESKSLKQLEYLYDQFAGLNADRNTLVVAVGGGVIGDLAGFASSTFNRGVSLLMVPTSLLAMVDSSVGGKVGINHALGKNLIGAFHQPVGVWIDTSSLESLPAREYFSGLAEVVKYGVIMDADFFESLDEYSEEIINRDNARISTIVQRCCRLKADVVEKDERETTGLRVILNYGHTFAHAFESVAGYGEWLHGEAVAAGMICASRLAEKMGIFDQTDTQRQIDLLKRFNLPVAAKSDWQVDEMIAVMRRDKKSLAGRLRFILPNAIGNVKLVDNVPEELVRETLRQG